MQMSMEKYSKNSFIMLCGLPGSGKSTYAKNILSDNTIWLSSDKIREELYGSEDEQGEANMVFDEMRKRTSKALKEGKDVVYDACNINSKKRIALLKELRKISCIKKCIICATPYEKCIERDSSRARTVKESVIKRMYMSWNTPFYYEGWDEISIFYSDLSKKSKGKYSAYTREYMNYNQETPYHTETLGVHLKSVGDYLIKRAGYGKEDNVTIAGYIHDCGKPFTKAFKDSRGNICDIAHYYQHQSVGAYDSLFFDFGEKLDSDILEISCLVGLHMNPFNWQEEKTQERYENLWGEDLYRKVMHIHEADEQSSKKVEKL